MNTLRHCLAAMLITIAAASPVASLAQPTPAPVMPSPVSAHVDVSIMVVAATEGAGPSDPRLEAWMPLLKVTPFQSFQMLDAHELRLGDTEEQAMRLSEGRRVRIQLLSHDLSQARLRVELVSGEEKAVDTTVTITRNKSFFLVVRGKEGAALLVPIVVRY